MGGNGDHYKWTIVKKLYLFLSDQQKISFLVCRRMLVLAYVRREVRKEENRRLHHLGDCECTYFVIFTRR